MGIETMMLAAAAASVAGTGVEGLGAFANSRYQAAVLKNQAAVARADAGIEAQLALEDGARELARGTVIAAKSGGGAEGSALNVLRDLSRQNIYEVNRITVTGKNASDAALAESRQAITSGNLAAFGTVLKMGAQAAAAPNGTGDGTLLSDAMAKRAQRGGGRRTTKTSRASGGSYSGSGRPILW